ncbi:PHP domain-containing protein [Candidatus Bathyarchaeota archaeon]|nr:PHP domain-containing protein [Candidatus Bathyarchaeota archaeon]
MNVPFNEVFPEEAQKLIDVLGKPEKGELGFDWQTQSLTRLKAIKRLKVLEEKGLLPAPKKCGGVNVHVHTNESFSAFRSPSEAAWHGYRAGLDVFGINDHYTIAGHGEFGEACKILGLKATFSIEIMAMHDEARKNGEHTNDPINPGRTYLCGKGVVHDLESHSRSQKLLEKVRAAFGKRCQQMTEKVDSLLKDADSSLGLPFSDVLKLTPRGNVTERHIAQAIAELIIKKFPKMRQRKLFLRKFLGKFEEDEICSIDLFQDLIRNLILKAGGPAYVVEPVEAFPSIEDTVQLFRDYGAIPTYPVLGTPVTEKEANLDSLFRELEGYGIFAVEVIPKRNTRRRLREIVRTAKRFRFPVFYGTKNNTKKVEPLLDKYSLDPEFLPVFRQGAYLILGHQFLSKYGGRGYINQKGGLTVEDRKIGLRLFSFAGSLVWPEESLEWLTAIGEENVYKLMFGLFTFLGSDEISQLEVKPGFKISNNLLRKIHIKDNYCIFADKFSAQEFEDQVRKHVVPI